MSWGTLRYQLCSSSRRNFVVFFLETCYCFFFLCCRRHSSLWAKDPALAHHPWPPSSSTSQALHLSWSLFLDLLLLACRLSEFCITWRYEPSFFLTSTVRTLKQIFGFMHLFLDSFSVRCWVQSSCPLLMMRWPKPAASPSAITSSKQEVSGTSRKASLFTARCIPLENFPFFIFPWRLCFYSLVVNVMQRDSIPSEVDYETRQGVYSICLQLARWRKPFLHLSLKLLQLSSVFLDFLHVIPQISGNMLWTGRVVFMTTVSEDCRLCSAELKAGERVDTAPVTRLPAEQEAADHSHCNIKETQETELWCINRNGPFDSSFSRYLLKCHVTSCLLGVRKV